MHEGGYRIQKVDNNEQRLNAQLEQQQHSDDHSLFDFEKNLRNDRESFDTIRKLSPTRYRFRIVDAAGRDIQSKCDATNTSDPIDPIDLIDLIDPIDPIDPNGLNQSTRVACAVAPPVIYGFTKTKRSRRASWGTAEQSAAYNVNNFVHSACAAY